MAVVSLAGTEEDIQCFLLDMHISVFSKNTKIGQSRFFIKKHSTLHKSPYVAIVCAHYCILYS